MNWNDILQHWPFMVFILLCASVAIHLFYQLFFFLRLVLFKTQDKFQSQTHPVSVVICARDEAHNLEKNLPPILTQQYPTTHEVMVVNDNSFDDTKFFLEELEKIFRHLKPVNLTQEAKHIPGKKYPLSIGIKSSKYEVMLLTDADCRPASEWWIQKMQDAYHDGHEIVLGYGAHDKQPGFFNKLVRFETFHTALQYLSYALAGMPYMGVGRNLSYRKSLFYAAKGFSSINHIPGGDDDMFINKVANKHNTAIVIDPDAFTYSEPAGNFSQWWKQKNRHYSTAKFYKPLHQFLLGLYALSNWMFWPLLVTAAIFYQWQLALPLLAVRWLAQGIVMGKAMQRLKEIDLIPLFWLFDIWQFFYYIIFSLSLFVKPKSSWK
jgi:glycosyltransferase involved in cell wall biosynthesis